MLNAAVTFEEFHRSRRRHALEYARAILGAREGAEDACQEAWMRVWQSWEHVEAARADAWMATIVRNCCIDRLRRTRRRPPPVAFEEASDAPAHLGRIEDAAGTVDARGAVEALRVLPLALREVLWLREVLDLAYAEIAEVQGVPVATVVSRLHRARRRSLRILEREGWR